MVDILEDIPGPVSYTHLGKDLGQLHHAVEQEYLTLNEEAKVVRSVMAKLETGLLRRLATFENE